MEITRNISSQRVKNTLEKHAKNEA